MIILGCLRLYLLKERTHVLTVIKDFINEVKIQFFIIRVLRTDNVPEYTQKNSHFCASHGILHQIIYPDTSHQNGFADRK